jgi:hypothetical protein
VRHHRLWLTAAAVAVAVGFLWFNYLNLSEIAFEPYRGFTENMDKFSTGGLAELLVVDVVLAALFVFVLLARKRRPPRHS